MDGAIFNIYGHCGYSIEKNYVHIYNLFIHPEFRNMGHALKILQSAIEEIRSTGYAGEIQIVAGPKDDFVDIKRLKLFYEKMGLKVFSYYG